MSLKNIVRRVADAVGHTRAAYSDHAELIRVQDEFDDLLCQLGPTESTEQQAFLAGHIGSLTDCQADHLAASSLARALTFLPDPATLRDQAAVWRDRADKIRAAARVRATIHRLNEDNQPKSC